MSRPNLCREVNCPSACCHDTILHGLSKEEVGKFFPEAQWVDPTELGQLLTLRLPTPRLYFVIMCI